MSKRRRTQPSAFCTRGPEPLEPREMLSASTTENASTTEAVVAGPYYPVNQSPAATAATPILRWHTHTIDFSGPSLTESGLVNLQLDYRLDVTFTSPDGSRSLVVPGYWAADGDAAFTHATSGSVWRVHFSPDEEGTWSYTASFRQGIDVAVAPDPTTGVSAGYFDGQTGSFLVTESDKQGADFRTPEHGLIKNSGTQLGQASGGHYLTYAGDGGVFLKGGTHLPENFLAYDEFDNTPGGLVDLHTYDAHADDWEPDDPLWDSLNDSDADRDEGQAILGAINFLAERGVNSLALVPMNLGGDGQGSHPFVSSSPADNTRYDISKLDQWQIVFEHAQSKGIFLHLQLAESAPANQAWFDHGDLGPERKLFHRTLVARFGHQPGLQWDLGEENAFGFAERIQFASHLKSLDPYDHPVTTHTAADVWGDTYELLRGNGDFDITSFQGSEFRFDEPENEIEEWRHKSAESGERWVVSIDEPLTIENDRLDTENGYARGRTEFLWPAYLSGAGGFEWYAQQEGGDTLDLEIDDFGVMDVALDWTGFALDFLGELPLESMTPDKTLGRSDSGDMTFVLHEPGEVYALYNARGGVMEVDLTDAQGFFEVWFFNPRTGELSDLATSFLGGRWRSLGLPPDNFGEDWAAIVRRNPTVPNRPPEVTIDTVTPIEEPDVEEPRRFLIEATVDDDGLLLERPTLRWTLADGPSQSTAVFSDPESENTEVLFSQPGRYLVRLSADDGELTTRVTEEIVVNAPNNEPPNVDAGPDQVIVLPSNTATLTAVGTDDGNNRPLIYLWRWISGPSRPPIAGIFSPTTQVTLGEEGIYVFEVTVNDGELTATDRVQVRVSDGVNLDPTASIVGFEPTPDGVPGRYRLLATASDPDDDPLALGWEVLDGPGVASDWTGQSTTEARATFSTNAEYLVRFTASDGLATASDTRTLFVSNLEPGDQALVLDRRVFYNDSLFDGNSPALSPEDDNAIAPDKSALLPGQTATFANYVTGPAGLTGLMIDLADLTAPNALGLDDFAFRTGTDTNLADWTEVTPTAFNLRYLDGVFRASFSFAPGTVLGAWLEAKVLPTPAVGLAEADTFFFGSVPGDTGDALLNTIVDLADAQAVAENVLENGATVDNPHDLTRDGVIDADDLIALAAGATDPLTQVRLISVSADATRLTPVPLLPGDFNLDHRVDAADYTVWRDTRGAAGLAFTGADASGDGLIDEADRNLLYANYFRNLTAIPLLTEAEALALLPATIASAPEPAPPIQPTGSRSAFRSTLREVAPSEALTREALLLYTVDASLGMPADCHDSPLSEAAEPEIEPADADSLDTAFGDWF